MISRHCPRYLKKFIINSDNGQSRLSSRLVLVNNRRHQHAESKSDLESLQTTPTILFETTYTNYLISHHMHIYHVKNMSEINDGAKSWMLRRNYTT